MAIKDILLHLDAPERAPVRLELAAQLAAAEEAHLTGLFVVDLALPPIADMYGGGGALAALLEEMRAAVLADAARAEAAFRARCEREGIAHEWRLVEGLTARAASAAHYADLVVLGQAEPGGAEAAAPTIDDVLFYSGRPVLIVPYAGSFPTIGRRVLVGWKAGREASRALHDALPLMRGADIVRVLSVNPAGGPQHLPGAAITRHLARHGIAAEASHTVSEEVPEGDILLNVAAEMGADLLVAGGYGHSRLREFVLGGVTRTLLQRMTLPVLLSH
ncbi:MAG: universal stress protein [Elioraea tepidiphila]